MIMARLEEAPAEEWRGMGASDRLSRGGEKGDVHRRGAEVCCAARSEEGEDAAAAAASVPWEQSDDANYLQTELHKSLSGEDYATAAAIRDRLQEVMGGEEAVRALPTDWYAAGALPWLVNRVEALGCRFPTEVQRRAAPVLMAGSDAILQSQTGSGKTLAYLMPALSRLRYQQQQPLEAAAQPQALIMVPTRELGTQIALLIYRLFGGSINSGVPGNAANMFSYRGPRGLRVRGLLQKEEVLLAKNSGYVAGVHVVVATPDCIAEALAPPEPLPFLQSITHVVVDEMDQCWHSHAASLEFVLDALPQRPQTVLCGATIDMPAVRRAVERGWLAADAVHIQVQGAARSLPPRLRHRYLAVPAEARLASVVGMMRADLAAAGDDGMPPRVMLFTNSSKQAEEVAMPLRTAMWEGHRIAVLLDGGYEPIKALQAFRDNEASLLIAAPHASRGLDLPGITHVYNLALPQSESEYIHRAGRAGRIGAVGEGVVTTLVEPAQVAQLQSTAAALGIELQQADLPASRAADLSPDADLDSLRRGLEDLYHLFPAPPGGRDT